MAFLEMHHKDLCQFSPLLLLFKKDSMTCRFPPSAFAGPKCHSLSKIGLFVARLPSPRLHCSTGRVSHPPLLSSCRLCSHFSAVRLQCLVRRPSMSQEWHSIFFGKPVLPFALPPPWSVSTTLASSSTSALSVTPINVIESVQPIPFLFCVFCTLHEFSL